MAAHYGRWQLISAEIWKSKGLLGRWKYLSSELLLSTNKHQGNSSPFHFLLTFKQAIPNSSRIESKHKSQTWLQDLWDLVTFEKLIWQIWLSLRNTGRTLFTTMFGLAVVLAFQEWVEAVSTYWDCAKPSTALEFLLDMQFSTLIQYSFYLTRVM